MDFDKPEKEFSYFMKTDYYCDIDSFLNKLEKEIGNITYRGVSIFGFLRFPIFMTIKNFEMLKYKNQLLVNLRFLFRILASMSKSIIYGIKRNKNISLDIHHTIGFVLDNDYSSYLKMQFDIIKKFNQRSLIFITQNKTLYKKIRQKFPDHSIICSFNLPVSFRLRHFKALSNLIMGSKIIRKESFLFKLSSCNYFLRAVKQIDFYNLMLQKNSIKSIITLNDKHSHVYIVTNVAKQKGINTYTLQHGATCKYYAPVSSDKIFIWGNMNKKELLKRKVLGDKIVISGKPGLDDAIREYLGKEDQIRKSFAEKHGLDPRRRIVSFFPTRYAYRENLGRFKCFADICKLDISPLIKLRPNSSKKYIGIYKKWLEELQVKENVPIIIINEDLYEIFQATDVLITTESSVAMEALSFAVIVILLDIYDYINVKSMVLNYNDSLIVKNIKELLLLIQKIITDENYFLSLKNKSLSCSRKYFHNSANWDASSFIANYVLKKL